MSNFSIKITDNSAAALAAMEERSDALLEALGLEGVNNTVKNITSAGRVDTGAYRNSFTYALAGQPAAKESYRGENKSKYNPNAPIPSGTYAGNAPAGENAVYIGSNLNYAAYQEEGYHLPNGNFVAGTHALRNGVEALQGQAEKIARKIMGES